MRANQISVGMRVRFTALGDDHDGEEAEVMQIVQGLDNPYQIRFEDRHVLWVAVSYLSPCRPARKPVA